MSEKKTTNARPTHRIYSVSPNGEKKANWTEIGSAWPHKDGKASASSSRHARSTGPTRSFALPWLSIREAFGRLRRACVVNHPHTREPSDQ